MKIRLFKFPIPALLALLLLMISTSCDKETDLVSEFVINDTANTIEDSNTSELTQVKEFDPSN